MAGLAIDFLVVMDKQAIMQDGDTNRLFSAVGWATRLAMQGLLQPNVRMWRKLPILLGL